MSEHNSKMEHMRSKYAALGRIDNKAIDKKVDDILMAYIKADPNRMIDCLVDARESGRNTDSNCS